MGDQKKRGIFPVISKYQKRIIFSVFVPTIIMHLCLFGMLTFLHVDLTGLLLSQSRPENIASFVDSWSFSLIIISISFILISLLVSYVVSNNLVGGFERVIRELDEVLEGKRTEPLTARAHDGLLKDLLSRINRLIDDRKTD